MAVTLKDIAHLTGLSQPTVSHILNGRRGFSAMTRKRVMRAAGELGYRPHSSAISMRHGSTQAAAVILGKIEDRSQISPLVLEGVLDRFAESGMHTLLSRLSDEQLCSEEGVPRLLREHTVDGLLINYTHGTPHRLNELIEKFKIPAIWINKRLAADCVFPEDFEAAREATKYLIGMGHRRITYVDLSHSSRPDREYTHYSVFDRRAGYVAAMQDAGLSPVCEFGSGAIDARQFLPERLAWLNRAERPTAVVCYQVCELNALFLAACRYGLQVPRDLSILTFAYANMDGLGVEVSRMQLAGRQLGAAAVDQLIKKIADHDTPLKPLGIAAELMAGETVAAPT